MALIIYVEKRGVGGDEAVEVYKVKNGKIAGEFISNPDHKPPIKCG
jgi:hypothetical protein